MAPLSEHALRSNAPGGYPRARAYGVGSLKPKRMTLRVIARVNWSDAWMASRSAMFKGASADPSAWAAGSVGCATLSCAKAPTGCAEVNC